MDRDGFKDFLKEETVLPKDAEGWIDLFLAELNLPDISSYADLKKYLDGHIKSPDQEERVKSAPHYWELYEKSLKED